MKKSKLKYYLRFRTLLFGFCLVLVNCQNDDINVTDNNLNYKLNKLNFNQFKNKVDAKTLSFINPSLDVVKEKVNDNARDITSNNGSFTISTDEIVQVTTDSTETFTFKVTNKLSANHEFEIFLIEKINLELKFFIIGFNYNQTHDSSEYPYTTEYIQIDTDAVNLGAFFNSLINFQFYWVGNCLWHLNDADYGEPGYGYMIFIGCADDDIGSGGGGDGTSSNTGGGYDGGSGGTDGSDGFGDYGPTGGGGGSNDTNTTDTEQQEDSAPTSAFAFQEPINPNKVIGCLGASNLSQAQIDWINSYQNKGLVNQMLEYLNNNSCSEQAQQEMINFIQNSIDNIGQNITDPCDKIAMQIVNPFFKAKVDIVNSSSAFNASQETGFKESTNGTFNQLPAINNGHSLDLPEPLPTNMVGYLHSHINSYETGEFNEDGNPIIIVPIKMPSPADIIVFLELLENAHNNNIPLINIYGSMYSSASDYTVKFTGNINDVLANINNLTSPANKAALKIKFKEYFKEYNSKEKAWLHFLKNEININGIRLFKIKTNGTIKEKFLNSNGNVNSSTC